MKYLLYPFAWFYGLITYMRNKFFDWKILTSKSFKEPVIVVGNLNVGGTGKSPFVIYLVNLLMNRYSVGIMSRGYGRKTKGYEFANYATTFEDIGDEPMQFFERFRNKVVIGVDEKRTQGIKRLIEDFSPQLFILDDAFQHRYVKGGLNILLMDYSHPYYKDHLLPLGRLREGRYGAKRAQIIVVTKCPEKLTYQEKETIKHKLKLTSTQSLFFSKITYENRIISEVLTLPIKEVFQYQIILVTGIANPEMILKFSKKRFQVIEHLEFKDHHTFTNEDIHKIKKAYKKLEGNKIILTTEKDYMRLKHFQQIKDYLFYLPINIELDNPKLFENKIEDYLKITMKK